MEMPFGLWTLCRWSRCPMGRGNFWGGRGGPCAARMWRFVKLPWPLVTVVVKLSQSVPRATAPYCWNKLKPGVEGVQSTRWHFMFALCCHSNETRALIAHPPNSTQLEGIPYHFPSYIRVHAVVWECGDGQTHTERCMWPIYISRCLRLTRNVIITFKLLPATTLFHNIKLVNNNHIHH